MEGGQSRLPVFPRGRRDSTPDWRPEGFEISATRKERRGRSEAMPPAFPKLGDSTSARRPREPKFGVAGSRRSKAGMKYLCRPLNPSRKGIPRHVAGYSPAQKEKNEQYCQQ
jgi:hypothetical protein